MDTSTPFTPGLTKDFKKKPEEVISKSIGMDLFIYMDYAKRKADIDYIKLNAQLHAMIDLVLKTAEEKDEDG